MSTNAIEINIVEGGKEPHLARQPILSLEDKKTGAFHTNESVNAGAVQDMINAFGLSPKNLKFEIGWKPSEGKSLLFSNLKSSKATLTIFIYWFIKDSGKLVYSKNVVIKGGSVNKHPVSKGTPPNATQFVEFTATSFEASK